MNRAQDQNKSRGVLIAFISVVLVIAAVLLARNQSTGCDTAIINTKIWTSNRESPWADSMIVNNGIITFVGSYDELISKTDINSCKRVFNGKEKNFKMVVPGFFDTHMHMINGGFSLISVDLRDAMTPEIFINRIANFTKTLPSGKWIREGNWNHENWGGILPNHTWIDHVTPSNPVWLCRLDGHMCLANAVAMKLGNITASTPNIPGGEIVRDSQGNPTGILKDNAMNLIRSIIPAPSQSEEDEALDAAMNYLLSNGVTSIHHMGEWSHLPIFERARTQNRLKTRIYAAVPIDTWRKLAEKVQKDGRGDDMLKIGNLKGFTDGSLGSHTGLIFEKYSDTDSEDTGLWVTPFDSLREWSTEADKNGLQISYHAIGDRAVDSILSIFENITKYNPPRDRRLRIEHAQTVREQDRPRFAKSNIIASVQPYHAIDDGQWAEKLLGPKRVKDLYVFGSLLRTGAKVVFGSDWFVAPPIPLQGIYAAVTRSTLDGKNKGGWNPEEKVSVEEALYAYTIDASFAAFDDDKKGMLKEGYLADFVFLEKDITSIDKHAIWNTNVLLTAVNGQILFNKL